MSDITKISGYVAKKSIAEIKNELVFLNNIDTTYKQEFDTKVNGYKVGQTVKLKKPALMTVLDGYGADGTDMTGKFKEIEEEEIEAVVNSNPIVPTTITDSDATFALSKPSNEKEWTERVISPIAEALGSRSEINALTIYGNRADNCIVVDTAPTNYKDLFKQMNARLSATRAPVKDRFALVNTDMSNTLSGEVEEYFNPSSDIATAYAQAKLGKYGGMEFLKTELLPTRVNGCGGDTLTLGADYVEGSTSIQLVSAADVNVGDKIQFSFYIVDQQSKQATTKLAQRAVSAVSGNVITVAPMYFEGSERQNVSATALASGATCTGLGTADATYIMFPVYQKRGFGMSAIKQPKLGALDKINANMIMGGISLRIATGDDINTGASKQRAECLSSFYAQRSEWLGVIEVKSTLL